MNPRRVNRHLPQPSQLHLPRHLQHLREHVVQSPPMPPPERRQRPVVRPRPARQIPQPQVFPDALLQPPRRRHSHRIGIQPYFQHQRRTVQRPTFFPIDLFETLQVHMLHRLMDEETQMVFPQLILHARRYEIRLIRLIRQKSSHTSLSASSCLQLQASSHAVSSAPEGLSCNGSKNTAKATKPASTPSSAPTWTPNPTALAESSCCPFPADQKIGRASCR